VAADDACRDGPGEAERVADGDDFRPDGRFSVDERERFGVTGVVRHF